MSSDYFYRGGGGDMRSKVGEMKRNVCVRERNRARREGNGEGRRVRAHLALEELLVSRQVVAKLEIGPATERRGKGVRGGTLTRAWDKKKTRQECLYSRLAARYENFSPCGHSIHRVGEVERTLPTRSSSRQCPPPRAWRGGGLSFARRSRSSPIQSNPTSRDAE